MPHALARVGPKLVPRLGVDEILAKELPSLLGIHLIWIDEETGEFGAVDIDKQFKKWFTQMMLGICIL